MHTIISELEVNCVKIIFDNIIKTPIIILPYESMLTYVFQAFKVPLSSQTNNIKTIEILQTLIRMKPC